ncbi:MipA/OmpV family protein [Roseovarius atlanticus]|uniref:MipA/OmpV family protein n=1 Tax=Roseovarius atlanticus TaxID=1641875 RepID=UPI001C96F3EB|nr:MipA/OmpV family protein [Roseovarius atlanticus]MBY5989366.1 MipA/OmpV family protein [Roseovarius atlanticus]MBY6124758.1 MipA/OmpV family protein [Roseovarius atlanticus]MBY6149253.1 MipA/OmpV family protein [Roseovarius atlanticus]
MKYTFLIAAMAALLLPGTALAQSGPSLSFAAGIGGNYQPEYFGSDDYDAGVTGGFKFGHLRIGRLEFGDPDPNAVDLGWRPRGSLRLIGKRDSSDHVELTGLRDVDFSVEIGGGVGYTAENFQAFADVRYGVIGHESWVGELGADAIFRPSEDWTVTVGPRALWGSDDYTSTYFGVTPAEATLSAYPAYAPGSGLVTAGIEVGAQYELSQNWYLDGTLAWNRYVGDAADSPIVQDDDSFTASLVVMRRFNFGR